MPNITVTRSSAEDLHAAAGEQQQPQQQATDKAPRTTQEEPEDFTNFSWYQRINPEFVPVPNGSGSGSGSAAARKTPEPAPSPAPSMDERDGDEAVDANSSSLAYYLAHASLEQCRPGGRPASSAAAIVSDHQLHNTAPHSSRGLNLGGELYTFTAQASQPYNSLGDGLYNLAAQATQGADLGGGGLYKLAAEATQGTDLGGGISNRIAIAASEDPAPLKWGRKKRSRARREPPAPAPAPVPTPVPAPVLTPTPAPELKLIPDQAHCRTILRLKKRPAAQGQAQPHAEAEKLMPPPSTRGPIILDTSPHTPCAATISPLPPRAATVSQRRPSAEDPHAAAGEQQQQAADKAPRTTEQEPAPKVHEPKPPQQQPRRQPYRQAADKAAHGSNGEQEPAAKAEPRTPQPQRQRQQPPRQASMKEKGKAPMVQEPPAVAPNVAQRAAAAVEDVARPPVPLVAAQLTRKEKEEDWFAMTGTRLPYRPQQRRPKAVEDKLKKMSPGQTLWEVTRARYMVREKKQKKRPGLKAMAEVDALSSKRRDSDDDAAGEKDHFGVADAEERGNRRKRGEGSSRFIWAFHERQSKQKTKKELQPAFGSFPFLKIFVRSFRR